MRKPRIYLVKGAVNLPSHVWLASQIIGATGSRLRLQVDEDKIGGLIETATEIVDAFLKDALALTKAVKADLKSDPTHSETDEISAWFYELDFPIVNPDTGELITE